MGIKWQSPKKHLRALKMSYRKHNRKLHHYSLLLYPPAVCKFGGMSNLYLINIECRWCDLTFCICRSCWRGQAYCCDICRLAGKLKNRREAQRKYRKTDKGKKAHCESENRRRHGLSKKNQNEQKNMDDATTTVLPAWCIGLLLCSQNRIFHVQKALHCHFCGCSGVIVDKFPRRGYG